MRYSFAAIVAGAAVLATLAGAQAAEVEVKMLNHGATGNFVFEPDFVQIKPGDSVHFIAADKGHDAASIDTMLPQGAKPFAGEISRDITVTFSVPGVYGIECKPHYAMGMVALIVVGKPANLDAAKAVKQPGMAKAAFAGLFKKLAVTEAASR